MHRLGMLRQAITVPHVRMCAPAHILLLDPHRLFSCASLHILVAGCTARIKRRDAGLNQPRHSAGWTANVQLHHNHARYCVASEGSKPEPRKPSGATPIIRVRNACPHGSPAVSVSGCSPCNCIGIALLASCFYGSGRRRQELAIVWQAASGGFALPHGVSPLAHATACLPAWTDCSMADQRQRHAPVVHKVSPQCCRGTTVAWAIFRRRRN